MILKNIFLVCLFYALSINSNSTDHSKRIDSYPYISGDTFRKLSNFYLDETNQPFDPNLVKKGDIIFVRTEPPIENVKKFFTEYHPKIKNKYILITHNGDDPAPGQFKEYLKDEKLFAWFGQNCDIDDHPKFIAIPIGLENRVWNRDYIGIIEDLKNKKINLVEEKKHLLYVNFSPWTNPKIREPIAKFFKSKNFTYCYFEQYLNKSLYEYFVDVCHAKFVLSPPGNGLDCIRTWEALYLGIFVVVKSSTLDKLYKDLPVLIVNDWEEVTQDLLEKKYAEFSNKKYNWEKIYFDYWAKIIGEYQSRCKNSD